jgi:hypothetical protein
MRKILIFAVATIIASSTPAFSQAQYAPLTCAYGYYQNADGICVHKPMATPAGYLRQSWRHCRDIERLGGA